MMAEYSKQAAKVIERIDVTIKGRILNGISKIPAGDIVKMRGHDELYRLRIGGWRIIFSYLQTDEVFIVTIAPRGQVYKEV